jgi:hypothetical protein
MTRLLPTISSALFFQSGELLPNDDGNGSSQGIVNEIRSLSSSESLSWIDFEPGS